MINRSHFVIVAGLATLLSQFEAARSQSELTGNEQTKSVAEQAPAGANILAFLSDCFAKQRNAMLDPKKMLLLFPADQVKRHLGFDSAESTSVLSTARAPRLSRHYMPSEHVTWLEAEVSFLTRDGIGVDVTSDVMVLPTNIPSIRLNISVEVRQRNLLGASFERLYRVEPPAAAGAGSGDSGGACELRLLEESLTTYTTAPARASRERVLIEATRTKFLGAKEGGETEKSSSTVDKKYLENEWHEKHDEESGRCRFAATPRELRDKNWRVYYGEELGVVDVFRHREILKNHTPPPGRAPTPEIGPIIRTFSKLRKNGSVFATQEDLCRNDPPLNKTTMILHGEVIIVKEAIDQDTWMKIDFLTVEADAHGQGDSVVGFAQEDFANPNTMPPYRVHVQKKISVDHAAYGHRVTYAGKGLSPHGRWTYQVTPAPMGNKQLLESPFSVMTSSPEAKNHRYLRDSAYLNLTDSRIGGIAARIRGELGPMPTRQQVLELILAETQLHIAFDQERAADSRGLGVRRVRDVLDSGKGVCEDFSLLFVAIARSLGMPARVASGYLVSFDKTLKRPVASGHAWVEVLLEPGKWHPLEPQSKTIVRLPSAWYFLTAHSDIYNATVGTPAAEIFLADMRRSLVDQRAVFEK